MERHLLTKPNVWFESRDAYFESLTNEHKRYLDEEVEKVRADPLHGFKGYDSTDVLRHANMQDQCDNLYLVCLRLTKKEKETIQLVQAESYNNWCQNDAIKERIDLANKGQWYCTFLLPYYKNIDDALNLVSWRYQVHYNENHNKLTRNGEPFKRVQFSLGYCSFDKPWDRGGVDGLIDWSDPVSLLPYPEGCVVYGPFSWNKVAEANGDHHKIETKVWIEALPKLLKLKTTAGPMFQHGFSDGLLYKVAKQWPTDPQDQPEHGQSGDKPFVLEREMISDAKNTTPTHPHAHYVPVHYELIDPLNRVDRIERCVPVTYESTRKKRSYLFVCDGGCDSPSKKKIWRRRGMWMEKESKHQQWKAAYKRGKK
jgi:hypothetical protein